MPKRFTFNNTNIFRSEIEKNLTVNEQRKIITEITSCNFSNENEVYKIVEKYNIFLLILHTHVSQKVGKHLTQINQNRIIQKPINPGTRVTAKN